MESKQNIAGHEKLMIINDDFRKTAEKFLKKGLKEIDKVYSDWEDGFENLAKDIFAQPSASEAKSAGPPPPINENILQDIIDHLMDFEGFDLSAFMEKALKNPDLNLNLEPKSPSQEISRLLDSNFWKLKPGDTPGLRLQKRKIGLAIKLRHLFINRSKKLNAPWGEQKYVPRLLAQYYLAQPVTRRIIGLLEKRLREHARNYMQLHNSSEKQLRSVIAAASINFSGGEPENDKKVSKTTDNTQAKAGESIILTPVKSYLTELEEYISERTTIFLEKAEIAGTRLLDESAFGIEENARVLSQLEKAYRKFDTGWKSYFRAEGNDWIKDLEIILLQLQTIVITNNTTAQLKKKLDENILPKLDKLLQTVKDSFDRIKESENSPELKEKILKEGRLTLRELRLQSVPGLIDAYSNASFVKTLENFNRRVNHKFDALKEEFDIIQRLDIESMPPDISTRSINLKKIIGTEYLDPLTSQIDDFIEEAELYLGNILRTLNEIGHMIQVNLETAMEILDNGSERPVRKEDSGKVVSDGLDRIYRIIENARPESVAIPAVWGKEIESVASSFIRGVDELLDNENILDLIIRKTKADARRKYAEISKKVREKTKFFLIKLWRVVSFGLTGARSGYEQISKISGISGLSEGEKDMMSFLYTTRHRIAKLPFIYQRLYRFEALKEPATFVGRAEELERLEECFQLWKTGNFASVAIVGEKGSGRTSLINIAQSSILKQVKLKRINMPKGVRDEKGLVALFAEVVPDQNPSNIEELEQALANLPIPVALVVENLQNLFIRTIGGFDIIERFLLLISRTPEKVFWAVSCGKYLWNYLERVISINRYFYDVIMLSDLDIDTSREIILKRHRLSGYELEFLPGEEELADRKYKKLNDKKAQQDYLSAIYFKQLNELSRGNISTALLLWQLSVDSIKPNKVLISSD
ncbi:MAG TPA: hypothetical protein VK994_04940, partial [Bacteroidales bacterium]|nr:hypothetical protein [Bacteroidales bacterium]